MTEPVGTSVSVDSEVTFRVPNTYFIHRNWVNLAG